MNVYTGIHPYYCRNDLHAGTMYVCIPDWYGNKVDQKNMPCRPAASGVNIAPPHGEYT